MLRRPQKQESTAPSFDREKILDLVSQIRLGNKNAFEQIVTHFEQRLRTYCAYILGSQESGEDAAQEVFLKAYQHLSSFRADSSFSTWLMTLARNYCIDELRHKKTKPVETVENTVLEEFSSSSSTSLETTDFLQKVLAALPLHYRELLLLKELYGFSYEEISQIADLSTDAVKGQLKRAREKIEEILRHLLTIRNVNKTK